MVGGRGGEGHAACPVLGRLAALLVLSAAQVRSVSLFPRVEAGNRADAPPVPLTLACNRL
jgi:hypothetical protein